MIKENRIFYSHFRLYFKAEFMPKIEKNTPDAYVTVAASYNNGTLEGSFAFCSPSERFTKRIGREIALGRYYKEKKIIIFNFQNTEELSYYDATKELVKLLQRNKKYTPKWFDKCDLYDSGIYDARDYQTNLEWMKN